jgi:hypothetical protein
MISRSIYKERPRRDILDKNQVRVKGDLKMEIYI